MYVFIKTLKKGVIAMGFKCIWCGETDKRKEHSCKICDEQIALGVLNPKTDMICEECENKTFTELDRTLKIRSKNGKSTEYF